jgi:CubicO group peptidase (beta-lactamase class C family)
MVSLRLTPSSNSLRRVVGAVPNCGYAGATVRHLLDMRSGIAFSENYDDPAAEIHLLDQAIGWAPKSGPDVPSTLYDFLLTLR